MTSVPKWFVPVAALALLWNLAGLGAIAHDVMLTPADIAKLPPEMQAVNAGREPWMVIGSVVAVVAGTLGSFGLVLKRRWATPLFVLSLAGLIAQDFGFVLIARTVPIPMAGWILQGVVFVVAIALLLLARRAAAAGWLR